jgi:hypothetical protein
MAGPGRGGREAGKETETESRKRPSTGTTGAQQKLLPTDGPAKDGDGKAIGGQLEVAQGAAKGVSPVKPPMQKKQRKVDIEGGQTWGR